MITNKDIMEQGKLVQYYSLDKNPYTGQAEPNGSFENFLIYDHKVYSVITDFTGSIAEPTGEPAVITDDVDGFMEQMFFFENEEDVLESESVPDWDADVDAMEQWRISHSLEEDWRESTEW